MSLPKIQDTHIELRKYRYELNNILELMDKLKENFELIKLIQKRTRKLEKELSEMHFNSESDMCDSNCDGCVRSECPKIKKDLVSLYYGNHSIERIKEYISI